MASTMTYIWGSVSLLVLLSFIGVIGMSMREAFLRKVVFYLVSFSAGALFGAVFFHLLPEAVESVRFSVTSSAFILAGIAVSFVIEGYLHWHHHDMNAYNVEPFSYMILIGDALHNLIDGIVIASGYLVSVPAGIATTTAVVFHKVPKEIGDFGVLVHGGFTVKRAVLFNVLANLTSFIGVGIVLLFASRNMLVSEYLALFAAGTFIYIAGSDLIPEVKENTGFKESSLHATTFIAGILIMYALTRVLG